MFQQEINQYLTTHHYTRIDLKAVLFDMDGVLFDSMKNHATAWHKAMKQYGMSLSKEEAYLHEGRTGAATINIVSQRERGYEADEEEIKRIYQTKSDIFNQLPKADPMPGAFEVLKKIKADGLIPMVVTGSGQLSLLDKLNHYFPDIFQRELMVTAFDVKYGKPNPEPYLMALQKAGIQANEAVVIENAPLGVRAGVAAGIFTIALNTGPLPNDVLLQEGANILFPSMAAFNENSGDMPSKFTRYIPIKKNPRKTEVQLHFPGIFYLNKILFQCKQLTS